jgi:hypothetical protein
MKQNTRWSNFLEEVSEIKRQFAPQLHFSYFGNAATKIGRKYWAHLGNQTISKACRIVGIPMTNYWSGSSPTPAKAVPDCIAYSLLNTYKKYYR